MYRWANSENLRSIEYTCGHCVRGVASIVGYSSRNSNTSQNGPDLRICPNCGQPTYFPMGRAPIPSVPPGNSVQHVPPDVLELYNEARRAAAAGAATAAVITCRKLLMNIAVVEGAKEGESFVSYIEYLAGKGYVPPNGRGWVDHIRKKGNEANHEIKLMSLEDASQLILFSEMLLKFIYEFPNRVPAP